MENNNAGSVDVKFTNLVYTVTVPKQREKKNVLKNVSGTFKCGELTAIMGPSGAGKSSLLNILTGFTHKGVTGSIRLGDREATKKSRKICSYILQEDNLFPWFTVDETMHIAGKLKLTKEQQLNDNLRKIIDSILESLNLLHTKKTKCSMLSGGQRKRLSIALEMLDDPPIIFLDEPTTGLDSNSSTYCVKLLHKLSREGRTVVCTIHQPAATIYEMFDHVYVLADGNCIYQGSSQNTVPYLSSNGLQCPTYHNSADYLLEVATKEYGDYTAILTKAAKDRHWRENIIIDNNMNNNSSSSYYRPAIGDVNGNSEMNTYEMDILSNRLDGDVQSDVSHAIVPQEKVRLMVLIRRGFQQYFRDWTVTYLKIFIHTLVAIAVGLMFNDTGNNATKVISNVGVLLIGILYLWYTTCMPSVLKYPFEISVLKKEIFNNWYKLRTYYISTQVTAFPIHIVCATVYSSTAYLLTYQPLELERFAKYLMVQILITMIADGYGIFFGTLFDPVNGTFIGAVTSCFLLVFAGFLSLLSHMSPVMYWISYLSVMRYALEANVLAVLGNGRGELNCPETEVYCHHKDPDFIIKELGMTESNFIYDILCLIGQLVVVKILAYFTLKKRLQLH